MIGALSAAIAVGLGAFGAHGLRGVLTAEMLAVFETGVRYQMYHALALVALGLADSARLGRLAKVAGGLFVAGSVCFSGSLYLLTLAGIKGYNSGDKVAAVHALEYAAGQGHALARWKLGRMYAEGDGVPHDDLKAFEQFSRIADEHADQPPDAPQARFVASAFVALGSYFLDGIPGSYVKANPTRARDMFFYAASYFGDPDAQYNLARLMIEGQGGAKNPRQAMRWLHLAADKGHVPSQALLGHLLFAEGKAGRAASRGLMWLMLARDGCDPVRDAWIVDLYEGAVSRASASDRQEAIALLEDHLRKR